MGKMKRKCVCILLMILFLCATQKAQADDNVMQSEVSQQQLDAATAEFLLTRAKVAIDGGDVIRARQYYRIAVALGDASAAMAMGNTYDSTFLEKIKSNAVGDDELVVFWYKRALEIANQKIDEIKTDRLCAG